MRTSGSSITSTTIFRSARTSRREKPEKLKEMVDLWWAEADRYGALPLDDRRAELWRPTPALR